MAKIRNEELDQLAGEVLPERAVLGCVGGGHGSTTVASACSNFTTTGVLGIGAVNNVSCVPAWSVTSH